MKCAVFMFQKEVAARISASPCSRDYSSLSVFARYHYEIDKIRDIGGGNFWPNAGVTSTVLRFTPKKELPLADPTAFFAFVRASFAGKRKTLRNNLRAYDSLPAILEQGGFSPSVRAEELSLEDFLYIYDKINL
jgi:16S rRNA (adenine1518-N6/adenine1519-N6)-dimethyltransferase